nr:hypothetical protein [Solanum melongena]
MLSFSKKGGHGKEGQSFAPLFVSCSSMWNSSDQLEHAPSKKTGVESALKHHSDIKKSESEFQDQDSTSTLSTGQSNHVEAAMGKSKTVLQNFTAHPGWGGILDVQAESGTKASLSGQAKVPPTLFLSRKCIMIIQRLAYPTLGLTLTLEGS